jgi:hypothetical protein
MDCLVRLFGNDFMKAFADLVRRVGVAVICVGLAIGLCWRGLDYLSPRDPSMLAPAFCVMLALSLAITGVTVLLRGGDLEGLSTDLTPEGAIAEID